MTYEELYASVGKLIQVIPGNSCITLYMRVPGMSDSYATRSILTCEPFLAVLVGVRAYKYDRIIQILHPDHGRMHFRDYMGSAIRIKLAE